MATTLNPGDIGFTGVNTEDDDGGDTTPEVAINEIRIDQPSGDDDEYFELSGAAGTGLDGLTYLVIGDGAGGVGVIENVTDLSGESIPSDGFFLAAEDGDTAGEAADRETTLNFENGDNVTHLLVSGFTGANGDDLDSDDDGTLDTTPWDAVVDGVGLFDDGEPGPVYSDTVVGPDGPFLPGHVFRLPDGDGMFQIGGFSFPTDDTPGASNADTDNGGDDGDGTIATIPEVQGAQHVSPLLGQEVTTSGIVTAVDGNGFYLQDPTGDGDDATSDALFVFTSSAPGVNVGDELEVSGTVSEFTPGGSGTNNLSTTQISGGPTVTTLSTGNALPAAVIIGQGGRVPPSEVIDNDTPSDGTVSADATGADFDPAEDGIDFFESLEAMYVTAQDAVAVAPTNRFGEIFTAVDGGADATGISARGTLNIDVGTSAADGGDPDNVLGVTNTRGDGDFNPEKVQIDEDSGILNFDFPNVDVGAQLGNVTGVVGYSFGNFEIYPTEDFTLDAAFTASTLTPETTSLMPGDETLLVASYNVLNLDPVVEDVALVPGNDPDDVDDDVGNGRFDAIAQQIVSNLNAPDIIGLQEIQDNNGAEDDGTTAADETLQTLVDSIESAGGPTYEFIDNTFILDNQSGGQPGGNIRTAFLYDPLRVSVDEASIQAIGGQDTGETFNGARLPLVADFTFNGETVTIVNNHFSSKGGSDPILGNIQPPANGGAADERLPQAQAVADFVNGSAAENVVVLGDLNEFFGEEPLDPLVDTAGLNFLDTEIADDENYTFIFQGNSQDLDHILVNDALLTQVADFDQVHVNSEFAETEERASDHDPLVVALTIPEQQMVNVIDGTPDNDFLVGTPAQDLIQGGMGADRIFGQEDDDTLAADRVDRLDDAGGDSGVSDLRGRDGDDTLFGGNTADRLLGGNDNDDLFGFDGDDTLLGQDGDDLLDGGEGNDLVSGGSGTDTADYSGLNITGVFGTIPGVDADLRQLSGNPGTALHSGTNEALSFTDDLVGIENLIGTDRNDRLTGNGLDNVLDGGAEVGRDDRLTIFTDRQGGQSYEVTGDVAEYLGRDDFYDLVANDDGSITVTGNGTGPQTVGTDTLIDIEFVYFAANNTLIETDSLFPMA